MTSNAALDAGYVLLVEDDRLHSQLFTMAWHDAGVTSPVVIASDAAAAFRLLRDRDAGGQPTAPALVLLDLNLPGRDGLEILAEIRRDPALRNLRVVVFSTSSSPADIDAAVAGGADGYVTKPLRYRDLVSEIEGIVTRWLVSHDSQDAPA